MKTYAHLTEFLKEKGYSLQWQHSRKNDFKILGNDKKGNFVIAYYQDNDKKSKNHILIGDKIFYPDKKTYL